MNYRIVLLLALLPLSGLAEVYKCRLPDGRTEYSNTGCEKSSTLSVRRDDSVSPESRAEAERDVERMRDYVREREAANRVPTPAPGPNATSAGSPASARAAPPQAAVDECLRELERQAMDAVRRAEMEASCRSTASAQPRADGMPIYVGGGNSIGRCIHNVERLHLSPHERARRIEQCQGIYTQPRPPRPRPTGEPPAGKTVIVPEKAYPLCPPGQKNCGR